MSARTALYRFFGAEDALLYVGITDDVGRRWDGHLKDKPWWTEVKRQTVDWYPDRESAEEAEKIAIRNEQPAHNVRHSTLPRPAGPVPDPADVATTEARANMSDIIKAIRFTRRTYFLTSRGKRQAAMVPVDVGELVERVGGADTAAEILTAALSKVQETA